MLLTFSRDKNRFTHMTVKVAGLQVSPEFNVQATLGSVVGKVGHLDPYLNMLCNIVCIPFPPPSFSVFLSLLLLN